MDYKTECGQKFEAFRIYIGEYLYDMRPWKVFLNETQKSVTIRQIIDSFDYIKIKNFYSLEDSIKRQATEWEKIFATHSLTKDSHSEYVKNTYI